jgi:integrase
MIGIRARSRPRPHATRLGSALAPQLTRFLAHKRALGFRYQNAPWLLGELDRLAKRVSARKAVLTEDLVRRFLTECSRGSRSHHLTLVRQLARFLAVDDGRTFIPPRRFLGIGKPPKPVLRTLTRDEACRFYDACGELPDRPRSPRRGLIHGTALRALLLTGLRLGEVVALKVGDVDLRAGVVVVRSGKFGKSRFVPLAPDFVCTLRRYRGRLDSQVSDRVPDDFFFPGPDGHTACSGKSLYHSFRCVLPIAGVAHGGRGEGPRLHDLRHSFACLRLLTWYEQGVDLRSRVPLLATYLGHVGLATSQVYLHLTTDLVGEVVSRFAANFGDLITEPTS